MEAKTPDKKYKVDDINKFRNFSTKKLKFVNKIHKFARFNTFSYNYLESSENFASRG